MHQRRLGQVSANDFSGFVYVFERYLVGGHGLSENKLFLWLYNFCS
jgi:hypothetical protein